MASDVLQGLLRDAGLGNSLEGPRLVVVTDPAFEAKLSAFWGNPPVVRVAQGPEESPIPVYRDPAPIDLVGAACQAVLELHQGGAPGDVLVYLPSEEVSGIMRDAERKSSRVSAFC